MKELSKFGFQRVGYWRLNGDNPAFEFQGQANCHHCLYAFVCGSDVKYIGKTVKSIKQRMYQYQNPGTTQYTNIRNRKLICEALTGGQTVEVFVLYDTHKLQIAGIPVNVAAGLEDGLIQQLQPEWNITGKSVPKPTLPGKKPTVPAPIRTGGKYARLAEHLEAQSQSVTMTYKQMEAVLGFKLPESARLHRAWWSNGGNTQSQSWLGAGWKVSNVQLGNQVTFEPMKELKDV